MIRNYIKIACRSLWRHKGFSIINIIGLAIGLAACFLIYINIKFELSYDTFNEKFDRIYRVAVDVVHPNSTIKTSAAFVQIGPSLQEDFPEVQENARILGARFLVQYGGAKFQEENLIYADPSLFTVFTLPVIKGDVKKGFEAPFRVVMTQTMARKYFGDVDPVGKTLTLDGKYPALVTAVIKDVPANSHFKFDMAVSYATFLKFRPDVLANWAAICGRTYVVLPKGYNSQRLESQMTAFANRHYTAADKKEGVNYDYHFVPLKDIYMDTTRGGPEFGDLHNMRIFSAIAVVILLIACINFINLTTARAAERAKEVGIRKVIGAARKQLIIQFLSETVIICLFAFLFTILLSNLLLPFYNQLSGKITNTTIFVHGYVFDLFLLSLSIGAVAGLYPAFVLSGFKPIATLSGRISKSFKGIIIRKSLVVVQFTVSIILIVGTIVVYTQLNYMRNQPLGFQKNQMMTIDFFSDTAVQHRVELIKNELKKIPNVISVTASRSLPGFGNGNSDSEIENHTGVMQQMLIDAYYVDYDFIPQFEVKVAAGRIFSKSFGTDTSKAFLINEAAAKSLGYSSPSEAIGRKLSQWGRTGKIIGVLKDFHFQSLQEPVKPLSISVDPDFNRMLTLKIAAKNIPATIAAIQNRWKTLVPERQFNYAFVDETFNAQYAEQVNFGKLFMYFAVLAILISCMGLFGLASYSTIQRTREIGIRKVLGASVSGIVNMLSAEFLKLVILSSLIAFPLAWLTMHRWLQDFAYRIAIGWWVFALAGMVALVIAFATVSFQALKAALTNPVKSLRSE
ncbi:putative ABC transport system permease protein [Mucilaginibacter sp. SG538B]|uniref:ABC transporter permease n=1 Tax=Mucilaginibacter sp. SG538B TaxID=2587021 RepID=UPI00159D6FF4|nr:ABC transporter permease [Mucilaginibacter sp. SG538B]NVM63368.1 putative ABC transport system permease protein [Mucilaginibacter sp. SG538B]